MTQQPTSGAAGASVAVGYVYCLSNPAMPGLVKIGFSNRSAKVRADELFFGTSEASGTGVPLPFEVVKEWPLPADRTKVIEAEIHEQLSFARVEAHGGRRPKEFFRLSPKDAVMLVTKILRSRDWDRVVEASAANFADEVRARDERADRLAAAQRELKDKLNHVKKLRDEALAALNKRSAELSAISAKRSGFPVPFLWGYLVTVVVLTIPFGPSGATGALAFVPAIAFAVWRDNTTRAAADAADAERAEAEAKAAKVREDYGHAERHVAAELEAMTARFQAQRAAPHPSEDEPRDPRPDPDEPASEPASEPRELVVGCPRCGQKVRGSVIAVFRQYEARCPVCSQLFYFNGRGEVRTREPQPARRSHDPLDEAQAERAGQVHEEPAQARDWRHFDQPPGLRGDPHRGRDSSASTANKNPAR